MTSLIACRGHVAADQSTAIPTFTFLSAGIIVDAITSKSSEPTTTLQHLNNLGTCSGKMSLVVGIHVTYQSRDTFPSHVQRGVINFTLIPSLLSSEDDVFDNTTHRNLWS